MVVQKTSKALLSVLGHKTKKSTTSFKSLLRGVNKANPNLSDEKKNLVVKTLKKINRDPNAVVSREMKMGTVNALGGAGLSSEFKKKPIETFKKIRSFSADEDDGDELGPLMKKKQELKKEEKKKMRILGRRRLADREDKGGSILSTSLGLKELQKSKGSIDQVIKEKNKLKQQQMKDESALDLPID